jgi:DHA1 family bicyclomycin/chloramphenicol resistance-like MFS transporter
MAALFAFVADSSFVFQQQFGLSHFGFGIAFAGGGFFVIVGTQANGSLVHRFSSQAMLTGALVAALAGAAVLVATTSTGIFGLAGVLVPLYVTLLALGLAMPNPPVLALERYSATAGTAAALVGAGQFGIASATAPLGSLLSSALGMTPATAMAVVIAAGLALSLVAMALLVRPGMRSAPPEAPEATAPRQEEVATASRTEEAHRAVSARPAPAAEAARRAARPSSRRRPVGAGRRSER